MNKFKKALSYCLSAALSLSMLAACSSGGTPSSGAPGSGASSSPASNVNSDGTVNDPSLVEIDPNKLVLWSLFSGGDGEYMDKIIQDYNATNPKKQVQSVMLVWADYYTKLATAVAAGKGPDIGISHISKLPELVEQGIALPIDDYAAKSGTVWTDYTAGMNEGVTFDGEHYAMPLDTHAEILYFNQDIVEKAGLSLSADGQLDIKSDADFKTILDTLKETLGEGEAVLSLSQKGDDPYRIWWALYYQMGGTQIVNADSTEVTLDKAIAVKAAEYLKSLYDEGYIPAGIEDHQKFFQGGKAALSFGGTWATGAYSQTDNLNFTAQSFPTLFQNNACWADAHTLVIPASKTRSDEDTQAAVDFINYVASVGALTWAESGQIPSNIPVQESNEYMEMPYRKDYVSAAENAVLPTKTPAFYSMKDAMIKSLDTIWLGQAEPAAAIDDLYSQLQTAIS